MKMKSEHILVCPRFRPPTTGYQGESRAFLDKQEYGKYDHVFLPADSNHHVYKVSAKKVVEGWLSGCNGCIMAYGQTGSGKTHTLFGTSEDKGIILSALEKGVARMRCLRRSKRDADKGAPTSVALAASFFEVYNENIHDLLRPDNSGSIQIKESTKRTFYVSGATTIPISDAHTAVRLYDYGNANRTIGCSYVHERSSRAHTVFRLHLAVKYNNGGLETTTLSQLDFVDLAGAEILSSNLGSQNVNESKAINTSLFVLRKVIAALSSRTANVIPYRESVLTKVLQASLAGNSRALMLVTCSPEEQHARFTRAALSFGDMSRQVKIKPQVNAFVVNTFGGQTRAVRLKEKPDLTVVNLDKRGKTLSRNEVSHNFMSINEYTTKFGDDVTVHIMEPLNAEHARTLVLCLHAFGNCSGRDWASAMRMLASHGYRTAAPDFPGFGQTSGKRQSSRTERMDQPGEALGVCRKVLEELAPQGPIVVLGWDWGGGMAMHLAMRSGSRGWPKVACIGLYHPTWTDAREKLAAIKIPALICWLPADQLHPFKVGKEMARTIPKSKLVSISCRSRTAEIQSGGDRSDVRAHVDNTLVEWIVKITTPGVERDARHEMPISAAIKEDDGPQQMHSAEDFTGDVENALDDDDDEEDEAAFDDDDDDDDDDVFDDWDDGASDCSSMSWLVHLVGNPDVISQPEVVKRKERPPPTQPPRHLLTSDRPPVLASALEAAKWAVERYKDILQAGQASDYVDAFLKRNNKDSLRPAAARLLGSLPTINMSTTAQDLVKWGIWNTVPKMAEVLPLLPKYPKGRQVAIRTSVEYNIRSPDFGKYDGRGKHALTYLGRISGHTPKGCAVDVPSVSGGVKTVQVSWRDMLKWNEPTKFQFNEQSDVVTFDDNIRCRFRDPLTKCKMVEAALAVSNIVDDMDFGTACNAVIEGQTDTEQHAQLLELQLKALARITGVVNMTHLVHVGRDPTRLCVPDVGRLMAYGQWHCHGMASVHAAVLLPFARILGIHPKYREGFFAMTQRDLNDPSWNGQPRELHDHTWTEVTFLPSGVTVVSDPSNTPPSGTESLCVPLNYAYSVEGRRFPNRSIYNEKDLRWERIQKEEEEAIRSCDSAPMVPEQDILLSSMTTTLERAVQPGWSARWPTASDWQNMS